MAFLQPPNDDPSLLILLLIVSVRGQLKRYTFQWDSAQNLQGMEFHPHKHPVDRYLTSPVLLIPLKISPGFALVCEQKLGVCGDVRINEFAQIDDLCDSEESVYEAADDPGSSLDVPLYTSWARPPRHAGFNARGEDTVYLCREDGLIRLVEFHINGRTVTDSNTPLGHLRVNVNTAFTVLDDDGDDDDDDDGDGGGDDDDSSRSKGLAADVLLVGGNKSSGGLFVLQARKDATLQQSVPNWTPIRDLTVVPRRGYAPGDDVVSQTRIFTCSGWGRRHGSVCEIRYGIQALEIDRIGLEDSPYRHLWLLPDESSASVYVLASSAAGSDIFCFNNGDLEPVQLQTESAIPSFIDRERPTICAGRTRHGIFVQVTELSIKAISLPDPGHNNPQRLHEAFEGLSVANACIEGAQSSLLMTAQTASNHVLLHARLLEQNGSWSLLKSKPLVLEEEPTCIHIVHVEGCNIAFVGTRAGDLQLFEIIDENLKYHEVYRFEEEDGICEGVLVLSGSQDERLGCLVLCGLRSGSLHILRLQGDSQGGTKAPTESACH